MRKIGLLLILVSFSSWIIFIFKGNEPVLTKEIVQQNVQDTHFASLDNTLKDLYDKKYASGYQLAFQIKSKIEAANKSFEKEGKSEERIFDSYELSLTNEASKGLLQKQPWLAIFFTLGLLIIGAVLYILPSAKETPGIKNNGIFRNPATSVKWLGILIGTFLIAFYIVLYFYPAFLVNWLVMLDPLSKFLNGNAASQWFLYGLLYTIAVVVMGIRMLIKYRHSKYQQWRTASVMFFQLIFAFLIPEILTNLNLPSADLKNMWPLDYSFFFDYRIDQKIQSGAFGVFLFVWGIALFMLAVPILTYFYGKRWYCSWVCGCGGLAETLGDPFRQLSNKSLKAWKIERYLIHSVLVFAVIMTAGVIYSYLTGKAALFGFLDTGTLRYYYGFAIGSIFSGVVGTGFYPLMGNRVWCRFGCPLAAYLGIIQRFKSRFRITTNGGQCISCGNCSTYCEQGIDVRSYAQQGKDILRASCVGCGVCSAVCPRGVLNLENLQVKAKV